MRRHLIFPITRYSHGIWTLKALIITPYVFMGLNKQLNMFPISTYRGMIPNDFMAARSAELLKFVEKLRTHSFSQDLLDKVHMDFCGIVKDEMQQKIPKYEHKINTVSINPGGTQSLNK